jgi:hypothetical protein
MLKSKKPSKKLDLNTQTLRALDQAELRETAGAGTISGFYTCNSCSFCTSCWK